MGGSPLLGTAAKTNMRILVINNLGHPVVFQIKMATIITKVIIKYNNI